MTDTLRIIPRVTDMKDGTFRPEVVLDSGTDGAVGFGPLRSTAFGARQWAKAVAEAAFDAANRTVESACAAVAEAH
jgi:hypothetical protein